MENLKINSRLVKIGNSQGVIFPKVVLENCPELSGEITIEISSEGIHIKPKKALGREGWKEQFALAIKSGDLPEKEMLEGFENKFDNEEWTW